jgi:hypothetical protein
MKKKDDNNSHFLAIVCVEWCSISPSKIPLPMFRCKTTSFLEKMTIQKKNCFFSTGNRLNECRTLFKCEKVKKVEKIQNLFSHVQQFLNLFQFSFCTFSKQHFPFMKFFFDLNSGFKEKVDSEVSPLFK